MMWVLRDIGKEGDIERDTVKQGGGTRTKASMEEAIEGLRQTRRQESRQSGRKKINSGRQKEGGKKLRAASTEGEGQEEGYKAWTNRMTGKQAVKEKEGRW